MRIYTKTGDKGETSLIGGTRVPKDHIRIEAYGTVDELNSYIGLIRDQELDKAQIELLVIIQDRLFTIGARLAADPQRSRMELPELNEEDVVQLEKAIDAMNISLPEMKSFVLPGGNTIVSFCHISRCVCRRAERKVIHLSRNEPVDELIIKYLNRLSDYLFVLARKVASDKGTGEIPWSPGSGK